ncbi:MAG: heme A synthase [Acidimicrobiales bacterium]|nr:heme A synthase [Acidimicrobiales bacterium]
MVSNVRISPNAYRRVVMGAGIMLAVIVMSGAAVRLTSSGLGCEDWPTCTEDSLAPEWSFHAWVEFGNRLFTGVVSAAVIAAVLAAHFRTPRDRRLVFLAGGLVLGVLAQILVGAAVVLLELTPVSVTAHFLISMLLLANAVVLYRASSTKDPTPTSTIAPLASLGHLALAAAVLVSGTVVTGTGPNSGDVRANRLPFDLGTVARLHSVIVWVFLAATVTLAVTLRGVPALQRTLQVLLTAVVVQGGIGYLQYFTGVPPLLVQLHVTGSIVVWCASVWLYLVSRGISVIEQSPHPSAPARLVSSGARP